MIKEHEIEVSWCYQNRKHYEELGYKFTKYRDKFTVKIDELSHGSNIRITAICDECGAEKRIKYQDYLRCLENYNVYMCNKCSHKKVERTCMKKYGTKSPLSNPEVIRKREETNLKKYGVRNLFDSDAPDFIKDKMKSTMLQKYGVENIFQDVDFIKECVLKKYGVTHHFKLEDHKLYGEKSPNYNPDLSMEDRVNRRMLSENTKWRNAVYERDKYICQVCGYSKGGILVAHHIYAYKAYPLLRFNTKNGITLCKDCHKKFHDMYGYGDNTLEQFHEFIYMVSEGQTTIRKWSTIEDELLLEVQNILN